MGLKVWPTLQRIVRCHDFVSTHSFIHLDLTEDILLKLDDLEKFAEDLDERSIEDENVMNIYLETEPHGRPKYLKTLMDKNETTESEINRQAKVSRYLFSGRKYFLASPFISTSA